MMIGSPSSTVTSVWTWRWVRSGRPSGLKVSVPTVTSTCMLIFPLAKSVGVILPIGEYHKLLEDMEELESIRAYDAAKDSGDEAIPFEQAVRELEQDRQ